jgi:xanthine dehydrogenase accessory factor
MKELRDILNVFMHATEPLALATIVRTTGSSYRKAGARMLILPEGRTVGTLSGGCIEEEVALRALPVIATGSPALFVIDTLKRFGCHGTIEIFVERIELGNPFLNYLLRCFAMRVTARVRVVFEASHQLGSMPKATACPGSSGFEESIAPPVRLIILGESPGTESLKGFAHLLGWDCLQPDASARALIQADARTAVVIKQHHFGKDCTALQWALSQRFGYVGLLGSGKRKRQLMNTLLSENGIATDVELEHFHGPAGLDLGADSPDEVALAIIAEIQAVLAHHAAGFLRDRPGPIHAPLCPVMA